MCVGYKAKYGARGQYTEWPGSCIHDIVLAGLTNLATGTLYDTNLDTSLGELRKGHLLTLL